MNRDSAIIDYSKLVGFDAAGPNAGAVDFRSGALAGPVGAKVGVEPAGPVVSSRGD